MEKLKEKLNDFNFQLEKLNNEIKNKKNEITKLNSSITEVKNQINNFEIKKNDIKKYIIKKFKKHYNKYEWYLFSPFLDEIATYECEDLTINIDDYDILMKIKYKLESIRKCYGCCNYSDNLNYAKGNDENYCDNCFCDGCGCYNKNCWC